MAHMTKDRQQYICWLCVVLALVCAFSLLIPHLHECDGVQCSVCTLVSVLKLWIPPATGLLLISITILNACRDCTPMGCECCSLVQLKVKLSD